MAGERRIPFLAEGFLLSLSLPNFYFHAATAYDILRFKGAPLGKRDFIGQIRTNSRKCPSSSQAWRTRTPKGPVAAAREGDPMTRDQDNTFRAAGQRRGPAGLCGGRRPRPARSARPPDPPHQPRCRARAGRNQTSPAVFLGDYIDRGTASRGVIERVLSLSRDERFEVISLRGNHEQALLDFLVDPATGPAWTRHGGSATLQSYGVRLPAGLCDDADWAEVREAFAIALPASHLAFFRGLPHAWFLGDYMFVHAGVRHGTPLTAQSQQDMLWIRDDFLGETRPFDKIIVHGHTPSEAPFSGPHRIGLDTGAYATGLLSALRLRDGERGFLSNRQTEPADANEGDLYRRGSSDRLIQLPRGKPPQGGRPSGTEQVSAGR